MKLNLNVVFFDRILLTNQKIQYSKMKKNQRFEFTTCWVKCVNIEVEDELCYLKC